MLKNSFDAGSFGKNKGVTLTLINDWNCKNLRFTRFSFYFEL